MFSLTPCLPPPPPPLAAATVLAKCSRRLLAFSVQRKWAAATRTLLASAAADKEEGEVRRSLASMKRNEAWITTSDLTGYQPARTFVSSHAAAALHTLRYAPPNVPGPFVAHAQAAADARC